MFTSRLSILFICAFIFIGAFDSVADEIGLIPMPQNIDRAEGYVYLPQLLTYSADMSEQDLKDLQKYLPNFPLKLVKAQPGESSWLTITVDSADIDNPEGYRLCVTEKGVEITASSYAGVFYGLQSLAQLARGKDSLPLITINDYPRFDYRGVHFDVSRHFFGTDYIKKQLDLLATYKINRLHWHLTDSEGWRLEIPSKPRLTDFAAWRPDQYYTDWCDNGRTYCEQGTPGAYGGYYTEEDVRDVVEYARLRNITVIPEIELPGHSAEVCAAYPELACNGNQSSQSEVCIGNEETFKFFEEVLDEVIRLFPSQFIHIGGDEASRDHWKECDKCQQRIKDEGLADEAGLQSYMIERIEKYINGKGREIIGWDEILEGGLAPNATVMSWRGIDGGIQAAKMGHNAIMTPEPYCYLDHPQDDPASQPKAFGPPLSLMKCYSYDPAPDSLGVDITRHIIGVQGNNWTELIPTYRHAEYMLYPRIIALAEVGWTEPQLKDEESFKHRINDEIRHIRSHGYNAFTLSDRVHVNQSVDYDKQRVILEMSSEKYPVDIRYTTDGTIPTSTSDLYVNPLEISDSLTINACLFEGDTPAGPVLTLRSDYHKGIGKSVRYTEDGNYYRHNKVYTGGGDTALVDGLRGSNTYGDGRWQGFCPNDLDITIDLGEVTDVSYVIANFMNMPIPSIFLPASVEVWASTDGKDFQLLGKDELTPEDDVEVDFREFGWKGAPVKARYIRYHANQDKHGFLFTDEIVIQ